MASCPKCGKTKLPKRKDGRRYCKSCGPMLSIADRYVANRLGCRPIVGLAEYGREIGLDYAAAMAVRILEVVDSEISRIRSPRLRARTGWMETVQ